MNDDFLILRNIIEDVSFVVFFNFIYFISDYIYKIGKSHKNANKENIHV